RNDPRLLSPGLRVFGDYKKFVRPLHRQTADIPDGQARNLDLGPLNLELCKTFPAADGDRQDFRLKPFATTSVAELRAHIGLQPVANEFALAVADQPFQVGQHALERAA